MSEKQLQTQGETAKYLATKVKALETLLPKHLEPERFLRIVFLQMQKNQRLAECTKESIYAGMMSAAELGLVPDGRQGWLIPYWNSKKNCREAQFQSGYLGIVDRARQSGEVADVYAASVRENDEFEYELGFNRTLRHRPNIRGNRGPIVAVYCVVEMRDGTKTFGGGPMTAEEVNEVRARSKSANDGPWITDWEAMAWKTVAKRVLKWVPQSDELRGVIEADDKDYGPPPAPKPVTINDLMAGQGQAGTGAAPPAEEPKPDKRQSPPADDPDKPAEREWPKPGHTPGSWIDSDGVIWNPDAHASFRGPRPSVNDDGTFRAKRGYTHKARKLAEEARNRQENPPPPAGDGEGEPDDSGATGPGQDDAGAGDPPAGGEAGEGDQPRIEELTRQAIAIIDRCSTVDQLNEQEGVALDMVRGTDGVKAVEDAAVQKYRKLRSQ